MASYWCYRCNRSIRVLDVDNAACPHCGSGFVEAREPTTAPSSPPSGGRSPVSDRPERRRSFGFRRCRRNSHNADPSPYNPVVIMRSPRAADDAQGEEWRYQLYYDDGAGSGLRPLPQGMSELLLGSGFDRVLDQLAQLENNKSENPPACKSAVDSMPTIEIDASHVSADLQCAICREAFELRSTAREMPCKHAYHSDCILPWLSMRNSCPICRHQLPGEASNSSNEREPIGLTIWRLPSGGYAVGRFSGTRRVAERAFPVDYNEMDAGFNGNSDRSPRRNRGGRNNGMGRFFGNLVSVFRRFTSSSSISSESVPSGDLIATSGSVSD